MRPTGNQRRGQGLTPGRICFIDTIQLHDKLLPGISGKQIDCFYTRLHRGSIPPSRQGRNRQSSDVRRAGIPVSDPPFFAEAKKDWQGKTGWDMTGLKLQRDGILVFNSEFSSRHQPGHR